MAHDPDEDRIRQKAHELWVADGHPHGREDDHWIQAREIIAIQDSEGTTLLPRDTGAEEPIEEPQEALRNLADFPNLTDQGENLLTSTDREPSFGSSGDMPSVEVPISDQPGIPAKAAKPVKAAAKSASKAGQDPAATVKSKTASGPTRSQTDPVKSSPASKPVTDKPTASKAAPFKKK